MGSRTDGRRSKNTPSLGSCSKYSNLSGEISFALMIDRTNVHRQFDSNNIQVQENRIFSGSVGTREELYPGSDTKRRLYLGSGRNSRIYSGLGIEEQNLFRVLVGIEQHISRFRQEKQHIQVQVDRAAYPDLGKEGEAYIQVQVGSTTLILGSDKQSKIYPASDLQSRLQTGSDVGKAGLGRKNGISRFPQKEKKISRIRYKVQDISRFRKEVQDISRFRQEVQDISRFRQEEQDIYSGSGGTRTRYIQVQEGRVGYNQVQVKEQNVSWFEQEGNEIQVHGSTGRYIQGQTGTGENINPGSGRDRRLYPGSGRDRRKYKSRIRQRQEIIYPGSGRNNTHFYIFATLIIYKEAKRCKISQKEKYSIQDKNLHFKKVVVTL